MTIIEIPITPTMLEEAKVKAADLGTLKNSIQKGKGNLPGFLGEIAVNELLGATWSNTFDYDIVYHGRKIDVKTKLTTVLPRLDYEASVADFNTDQDCDIYAFCRVMKNLKTVYFCGIINKLEFYQQSRFLKKGIVDGSNNFVVKADCYNMFYYDMLIPEKVLEHADSNGYNLIG